MKASDLKSHMQREIWPLALKEDESNKCHLNVILFGGEHNR